MTQLARRQPIGLSGLFDWLDQDLPLLPLFRQSAAEQMIRLEESLGDKQYTLRAELPGIDPDKDIDVTVDGGTLRLRAERREEKKEKGRSEFRYGSFSRTIQLPGGANEDDVKATYRDGILEVKVGLTSKPEAGTHRIPIAKA